MLSFEEWRPHLIGAALPIRVLTDHKNLEYFATKQQLNQRQVRWSEFMAQFPWYAEYRPGKLGGKPDALTCRSGDLLMEGDKRLTQHMQNLLKPENYHDESHAESHWKSSDHEAIQAPDNPAATHDAIRAAELALSAGKPPPSSPSSSPPSPPPLSPTPTDFESLLSAVYASDPFPNEVLELLRMGARHCKNISLAECSKTAGCLRYHSMLYIPASDNLCLHVLRQAHDTPAAGHPGRAKTLELIVRGYFWPDM